MEERSPETHQDGAKATRTEQRGALENNTPQNAAGEGCPVPAGTLSVPLLWAQLPVLAPRSAFDCRGDCQPVRDTGGRIAGHGAEETGIVPVQGLGRKALLRTFLGESPQGRAWAAGGDYRRHPGASPQPIHPSAVAGPAEMEQEAAGTRCGCTLWSCKGAVGPAWGAGGVWGTGTPRGARPHLLPQLLAGSALPLAPPLPTSLPPIGQRLHPVPRLVGCHAGSRWAGRGAAGKHTGGHRLQGKSFHCRWPPGLPRPAAGDVTAVAGDPQSRVQVPLRFTSVAVRTTPSFCWL